MPEKTFLLTEALSINTNPVITLSDTECEDTRRLLGNNVLLYKTGNKITFNHSLWLEYMPPPVEPDPGESDREESDGLAHDGAMCSTDGY